MCDYKTRIILTPKHTYSIHQFLYYTQPLRLCIWTKYKCEMDGLLFGANTWTQCVDLQCIFDIKDDTHFLCHSCDQLLLYLCVLSKISLLNTKTYNQTIQSYHSRYISQQSPKYNKNKTGANCMLVCPKYHFNLACFIFVYSGDCCDPRKQQKQILIVSLLCQNVSRLLI